MQIGNVGVFPKADGTLQKILKVFEGEKIYLDPALQIKHFTKKSFHDFEDLRRELVSRTI